MLKTLVTRASGALLTILLASIVAFVVLRLLPGNPARPILGPLAPASAIAAEKAALGLNRPIFDQYGIYMWDFAQGKWGFDYSSGEGVAGEIVNRLPASLELGCYALLFAFAGAVVSAVLSVHFRRRGPRYLFQAGAYFGLGSPPFWVGLIALVLFAEDLHWLPGPTGRLNVGATPPHTVTHFYTVDALLAGQWSTLGDALWHLVLPALTLGMASYGYLYRLLRESLERVVDDEFIAVCQSKGLTRWRALWRHALPNSLLPSVTAGGLLVAQLVAGSVLVETVFDWPGVGQLVVQSILVREYAVVEAFVLLSAIAFVVVNLIVDACYDAIDPRVRRAQDVAARMHRPGAAVRRPPVIASAAVLSSDALSGELAPLPAEAVLALRDLEVSYGHGTERVVAVRGISLDVRRGEKVGVVGESGSGKSSLGLAIPRLLGASGAITAGQLFLVGRPTGHAGERELASLRSRAVSVVFQDPLNALDPVRTIYSQITEAVRLRREGGERIKRVEMRPVVADLLRRCEIRDPERVMAQYPHEISGGMRQRVMIAIALAGDVKLLVADEPTTALDVTTQAQILRLLKRLVGERSLAVILITHNLAVVSGFCDRVIVMYAGRIVEEGPAREVIDAPKHPYTQGLIASIPEIGRTRSRRDSIPGMPPNLREPELGCAFRPRCRLAEDACASEMPELVAVPPGADRRVRCLVVARAAVSGDTPESAPAGGEPAMRSSAGERDVGTDAGAVTSTASGEGTAWLGAPHGN